MVAQSAPSVGKKARWGKRQNAGVSSAPRKKRPPKQNELGQGKTRKKEEKKRFGQNQGKKSQHKKHWEIKGGKTRRPRKMGTRPNQHWEELAKRDGKRNKKRA